jgi:hypothetical protein
MTRAKIAAGAAIAALLVLLAFAVGRGVFEREEAPDAASAAPAAETVADAAPEEAPGFLYGRVTTDGGATFEGRLRWGGGQEAVWSDYFYGVKDVNPWAVHVPVERLPTTPRPLTFLRFEIARRERPIDLARPFTARFGEIARIEKHGLDVRVILKSGTVFDLDRLGASDFDDGVRVWDAGRGVIDLEPRQIASIELLPTPLLAAPPERLHGTVRTPRGDFTGFIQWDRDDTLGSDELHGQTGRGEVGLRFDTIRSIARRPPDSELVTLRDGREIGLWGSRELSPGNLGIYVDDPRYGRVQVSWGAFERVDFSPAGSGPGYSDFPPGSPLAGSVTTRDGRRLAGRLVYDLDESETTDTLDAPFGGVDYVLPFGLVASIVLPGPAGGEARPAEVTLHAGERLALERAGDLAALNAGLLVFADGEERPTYVPWKDVARIDFERPPAMFPPLGE